MASKNYYNDQQNKWDNKFGQGSWGAVADPIKQSEYDRVFGTHNASQNNHSTGKTTGQATTGEQNSDSSDISQQQYFAFLQGLYEGANRLADGEYQNGIAKINATTDKALRESYLAKRGEERNLPQLLKANGISGGGAESTYLGLSNNYGNSRNNLEVGRQDGISELSAALARIKAQNAQNYQNALFSNGKNIGSYNTQLSNLGDIANKSTAKAYTSSFSQSEPIEKMQGTSLSKMGLSAGINADDGIGVKAITTNSSTLTPESIARNMKPKK
ncbi:MAG: hypothetical protein RR902_00870 [Oscillospiraceae bacterium]